MASVITPAAQTGRRKTSIVMMIPSRKRSLRRGATVVEFAVVSPVLFLVLFGSIEFGRALMAVQCLEEASRAACRVAILRGATTAEIEAEADRILAPAGISTYTVERTPSSLTSAERWSPVKVEVTASFDNMSWLPMPRDFAGKTYSASCTMPKEYAPGG